MLDKSSQEMTLNRNCAVAAESSLAIGQQLADPREPSEFVSRWITTLSGDREVPFYKKLTLAVVFLGAFLALDGSSTASLHWEGAPPWYLPVGLSAALFLTAGAWSVPLVFICSLIAAAVNYHRPMFTWCGIPGAIGAYLGYVGSAWLIRKRRMSDMQRGALADIAGYLVACLGGSIISAAIGVLALFGDGLIHRGEIAKTAGEWWTSDALAIVAFSPFVILFVVPRVKHWLKPDADVHFPWNWQSRSSGVDILESVAQASCVAFTIWLVFGYAPAIPYQPLYLLFIPVIWVAVRRGLPGAVLTVFAICVGMTVAAWASQIHAGSLPRLQLAMLALGLTGLCLGAVVTERKRGERSLRESEQRYRLLFERNLAGVFRTTITGQVLECNPAAARLFGYDSPEEVVNHFRLEPYSNATERDEFLTKLKNEKQITNHEVKIRRRNGDALWTMVNVSLVESGSGLATVIEGTLVDITQRKMAEERVESLAYHDALTSLPNRTLFYDRLSQALAVARRSHQKVAVLFVDLDRFKTINDSLGHSVGDQLLTNVAARLRACAREQDTVARLGGDEFVITLTGVKDVSDVAVAAERFMHAMADPFVLENDSVTVGYSIGISIFPDHGTDLETLIKNADSAMYSAKENGRHHFRFFTADMNEHAMERLTLENALRTALVNDELFLVYQPQMDVATGKIPGLEALLRWRHPQLGLVPPDRFIRIAENTGLILPIGDWVLKTACLQARKWQVSGLPPVSVAVNVSAVQFRHEGFCERVRQVLKETGLAPQYLDLELTESVLLADADLTFNVLQELKAMGVTLTIDDFGTGYSSLSYLRRFPVSKLKIDRSFIQEVGEGDNGAIIAAIIGMANSLELKVIAEGVENETQMSFLRAHHCDGIQGYYFRKALAADKVAEELICNGAAGRFSTGTSASIETINLPEGRAHQHSLSSHQG